MSLHSLRSILDTFNATSSDICTSMLLTRDGVALVSASQQGQTDTGGHDEDRMSALSASILQLGHKFMEDIAAGELSHILIKGKGGYMLAIRGNELALAVLTKPEAETDMIFPQMERVMESSQIHESQIDLGFRLA